MKRLIENVVSKPDNEKMRKINFTNEKISENIAAYPSNVQYFTTLGWEEVEGGLLLKDYGYNPNNLQMGLDVIEQFAVKITNLFGNLGNSKVTGTGGSTNADVAKNFGGMNDWGAM